MDNADNRVMTLSARRDYVLKGASEYFDLDIKLMTAKRTKRDKSWWQKRYLVVILYDYTQATFQDIAETLGYKTHVTPFYHYAKMKDELSDTMYGAEKTKRIYNELLTYLNL